MEIILGNAGPGPQKRNWHRVNEHEALHPDIRVRRNPAAAAGQPSMSAGFPYGGVTMIGNQSVYLELLAWALRDSIVVLADKSFNAIQILFTSGQGQAYTPFGGSTALVGGKPDLICNIQSTTGQLPNPQSMLVSHIRQIIRADMAIADLLNFAYSTMYTFRAKDQNHIYFDEPGALVPSAQGTPYIGAIGSTTVYTGTVAGMGWPVVNNIAALPTGLKDPSQGGMPDMGVVITQGMQFNFLIDPTQFSFIANSVANGSWTTNNTGSSAGTGGAGAQISIELVGVLARGL